MFSARAQESLPVSTRKPAPVATLVALAAIGGLLAACGGSPVPKAAEPTPAAASTEPTPPDEPAKPVYDLPALALQAVEVIEAMAKASTDAAGDCGTMAISLQAIVDANQKFFADARAADEDPANTAELERLMQPHETRLRTAAEGMGTAVAPCAGDERMIKVMEGMPL